MNTERSIHIIGARQHNLRNVSVDIPRGRLTVMTGVSGSGKSSLAFDTIFAEGQRRYVESLSVQVRQFLAQMQKPDVDRIEGLSPTIAIEQRQPTPAPRATVATATDIYDYLRVLFAHVGTPQCWECGREVRGHTTAQVTDQVMSHMNDQRVIVLSPLVHRQAGTHAELIERVVKQGFVRARIDGAVVMLDETPALPANRKHTIEAVVDRLRIKPGIEQRVSEAVELAANLGGGRVTVSVEGDGGTFVDHAFSTVPCCPEHPDVRIDPPTPHLFSFNAPSGACPSCHGLGITLEFDPDLVIPDRNLSLADGAVAAWRHHRGKKGGPYAERVAAFCNAFHVSPEAPVRNLPEETVQALLFGTTQGSAARHGAQFQGVIPDLMKQWQESESEALKQRLHAFLSEVPCETCRGARLRREALSVRIAGRNIWDLCRCTVTEAAAAVADLRFTGEQEVIARPLMDAIQHRLRFLVRVGADYLTLDRPVGTLSGGEAQRIRLATQIGGGLSGVCYVLDEPTCGLHARDSARLAELLRELAGMDNTVIVVEHDEEIIRAADHVIDLGPGAGPEGGAVVAAGTVQDIMAAPASLTGQFLSGRARIAPPPRRRVPDRDRYVEVRGATAHNLKNITVRFPLGCLVCVTGVSGSGKSTLVSDILLRVLRRNIQRSGPRPGAFERVVGASHVDAVVEVDQTPIGRSPRSTPATYVGVFDLIRVLYAKTREAKIRGYAPPRFSFNAKGGRCEACQGQGVRRIAMHFLPDVYVTCDVCNGRRYARETLEIRYRGRHIADVLDMRVDEAVKFFDSFAKIRDRLVALREVGLGYMTLGQSSTTLSGGEAQRVKLAAELHKNPQGHTMYLLDEPTTGLHPADVRNLLTVLNRLVDRGSSVIVIEHNLDVIRNADWVIDLGPEGGEAGGRVVAEGTPEEVAKVEGSHTGRYLSLRA